MKVIVMCGKYDDFDPKIDKKVDFFHYISIGS
jgi:tRNA G37 N-methylase TrmD